jgi:serine/threonine protein phosphatase PrpC
MASSGQVKREEIADHVARIRDLDKLGAELITLANTRGGPDNITVVAARFDGTGTSGGRSDPAYSVIETEEMIRTPTETPAPPKRRRHPGNAEPAHRPAWRCW